MHVNDEIRAAVREAMQERRLTQTQLAEKLGVSPQALSRTLNERGRIPGLWGDVLSELGLELTVRRASTRLEYLLAMAASPDAAYFDSDENGRRVYHYGSTPIAEKTSLVWYDPDVWWVKLRQPLLTLAELGPMNQIDDNGVAKSYRILEGSLQGFRAAKSKQLLSLWSPFVPGVQD